MTTTLRPMSTGQVLDRTFNLYRRNFVVFFGIAMLPPGLVLLMQLIPLGLAPLVQRGTFVAGGALIAGVAGIVVLVIAALVGYAIAHAATIFAVSAVHLGRQTSISESYSRVRGRYGRVLNVVLSILIRAIGGAILIGLAAVALVTSISKLAPTGGPAAGLIGGALSMILMIGAFIVGIYYFLRYAVAVPACVLEDIKARAALARSVFLTKGDRGRIFVIYFLVGILNYILTIVLVFPAVFLAAAVSGKDAMLAQVINAVASFLAGALRSCATTRPAITSQS